MSEEQKEQQNDQQPNSPAQDELSDQELNAASGGIGFDPTIINPDALKNATVIGPMIPSPPPPAPGPASKV